MPTFLFARTGPSRMRPYEITAPNLDTNFHDVDTCHFTLYDMTRGGTVLGWENVLYKSPTRAEAVLVCPIGIHVFLSDLTHPCIVSVSRNPAEEVIELEHGVPTFPPSSFPVTCDRPLLVLDKPALVLDSYRPDSCEDWSFSSYFRVPHAFSGF
jgi:hypothetical protein